MRTCKSFKRFLCLIALLPGLAALVQAQEYRSMLAGRVIDPQGGVIPKVKVTATEVSTNSHYSTVTGGEGLFVFPMLPPGTYQLTAEVQGFKKYVQRGITVGTATRVSQDIKLEIGQVNEAVTVTADAPQLNTMNASASQVITTKEVENLPVNGRAPMNLALLGFGVVNTLNRDQNRAFENAGFSSIAMGGAATGANAVTLDGVPNLGTPGVTGGRASFSPPVEAVDEVQVSAFNVDASEGGASGGTIQITTKGGGNSLKGSVSEYYQSSSLNGRTWGLAPAKRKPSTHQNNWSGTLGGPIYIPKLFNGKDKAFFFISYEGLKDAGVVINNSKVPTLAERQGDFSGVATIYDPLTGVLSGGKVTRQAFAGNKIPANRLNPIALAYLRDFIPLPNIVDPSYNYQNVKTTPNEYRSFGSRVDFNLSERNKLTMKFGTSKWRQDNGSAFSEDPKDYDPSRTVDFMGWGNETRRDTWNASIDHLYTFTPTLVNNVRLGFSRYRAYYANDSYGYDATKLGFPAYLRDNSGHPMLPRITLAESLASSPTGRYSDTPYNVYQLRDGLTWSKGVHTIKFGGELQLRDYSDRDWSNMSGAFTFDNSWVRQNPADSKFTGTDGSLASFLLGLPANNATGYDVDAAQKTDSWVRAFWLHDDWRLRSNLTLNIGLRWEYATPAVESHNRQVVGFDGAATNSITAKAKAAYTSPIPEVPASAFNPTGLVTMADANHRQAFQTHNMFAPRFGFSWSPGALNGRTVIRGGFGIFYSVYGALEGTMYNTVPLISTTDNGLTYVATLSNPFPNGLTPTTLGGSITFSNPDLKNQYSQRWSLDIQQQLTTNTTLEVGYIGNHAVHLTNSLNLNAMPVQYLNTEYRNDTANAKVTKTYPNPFAGLMPWSSLNGATIAFSTLVKPFPAYTGVTQANTTTGGSHYESLAARLSKRFAKGWLMSVNYNFSKLIQQNSYLNAGDPTLEKRVSSDDRPHVLSIAGTYDLPFGKGRKLLTSANKWVDGVLGGWSIAGTYSYHSGAPIGFGNVQYYGGDLLWDGHNPWNTFDKTQINTDSKTQPQNNFRTLPSVFPWTRADSTNNVNFTLSKNFNIMEKANLKFRAEGFNMFNRPQFTGPGMGPTSSGFGVITGGVTNAPRTLQGGLQLTF